MIPVDGSKNIVLPYTAGELHGYKHYENEFKKFYVEWRKFVGGTEEIDTSVIAPEILESWKRCRVRGMVPLKKPYIPILNQRNTRRLLEENQALIAVGMPLIRNLCKYADGFTVCLFNREGFILETKAAEQFRAIAVRESLVQGAQWSEEAAGTTSCAIVLLAKKPAQIFGPQHFFLNYHGETSCSAPIFGPEGEFIGGISLIAHYYALNPHTLGVAVAAAQAIGNDLQTQRALHKEQLARCYQRSILASVPEALIAVDNGGTITMVNEAALKLLRIKSGPFEGEPIRSIIPDGNTDFYKVLDIIKPVVNIEIGFSSEALSTNLMMSCHPVHSFDGRIIGKTVVLEDSLKTKRQVIRLGSSKANFQFEDIWGQNAKFLGTVEQIRQATQSDSNVLLLGESGTGKDLFARAVHNLSNRKNGPYIAVNCSAIPRELIVSELFGYSEGAFTGSRRGGSQGKFEQAGGGTIFLDEIAETSLEFQAVLLRVVEEKSITRLGGSVDRPVDVRIIAATNKDLLEQVRIGAFRKDLYYRLNVFSVRMVPLRDRRDDIPVLTDRFVQKIGRQMGKKIESVDETVIDAFMSYSWPGNVRELQNVIERMVNMARSRELTLNLVPEEILDEEFGSDISLEQESLREKEKIIIRNMLKMMVPKNKIARKLNIARSTLYRKLRDYGLE